MKNIFGLEGHRALVVGGGFGSGRLLAGLLTDAGAKVAIADINAERAQNVAKEIGCHAIVGDVTTPEGANAIVDEAHEKLGGLTRLANIVGLVRMAPFMETDPAQWQQQLQLNLVQQMLICQAAGRHMLASGKGGAIALVASVAGYYGATNQTAYGIAKAGVMSLARTLAAEWGPHGIRVNSVAPDITATPRVVAGVPGPESQTLAMFDAMAVSEGVPLQRFGRTKEIAGPLLFLLSDLSSYMTGQCLVLDGGTMVKFPHATGAPKKNSSAEPTTK